MVKDLSAPPTKRDARTRGARSLLHGGAAAVAVAMVAALMDYMSSASVVDVRAFVMVACMAALNGLLAYLHRRWEARTGAPSSAGKHARE